MKKNKLLVRLLCVYLSCALVLMGCGKDFMVKKDENPVTTRSEPVITKQAPVITKEGPVITKEAPVITREAPVITKEKIKEAKVVFLHRFPATDKPYKKLSLNKAYTFYAAQERIKREGGEWKAFVNNERVILRNYGVNTKGHRKLYGPGYLEPGQFFLAKLLKEDADGNRIYRARFIGQCGNEIPDDDLMILETPVVISEKTLIIERVATTEKVTITEKVATTEQVSTTETVVYTDVDYEPALWAGLGGLLVGLGMGYLFWFGKGATTVVAAAGKHCVK